MRIIRTVKHLKEWQLTQQESGKTWALLPFLSGLPRESNALLHGARTRCDTVLAVLDSDNNAHCLALALLDEKDCDAVLLLGEELNYPCGGGLSLHYDASFPALVRTTYYQHLGLQLLRLFSLLRPQIALFSLHDLPQYWLAKRINGECFLPTDITATLPEPEQTGNDNLLYTVLQRCVQAILTGHDLQRILQRGKSLLINQGNTIRYFGCYNIHTLIHTEQTGPDTVLWAQLDNNTQSSYSVRLNR